MALVKKEKSIILSQFKNLSFTANALGAGGVVGFQFQQFMKVKSIMLFSQALNCITYGYFNDLEGNTLAIVPSTNSFGFSGSGGLAQGFAVAAGHQVFFENMVCGGISFENFVSNQTAAGMRVQVFIEVIQEVWENEF